MASNLKFPAWARWTLAAVLTVAVLALLAPVLAPFLVAAVLAYILVAPVDRLQRWGLPRVGAVLVVESLAILAVACLLLLLIPVLAHELPLLREQVPRLAARVNEGLSPWLARWGLEVQLDVAAIKAFTVRYFGANAEEILGTVLSSLRIGGSVALALIGNLILVPVVLFYLLMDGPRLWHWAVDLIPLRLRPRFIDFAAECDDVLGHYLRGQLLVMAVLSVYYVGALALAGFDLALPVGLFTGLAIFVPYVGFGLGLVLALLTGLLQFGSLYAVGIVALVFGVGQLLESFVLTPRLVGERIGLSPLAVIFVLLAFGHLLGFVGVLVALPAGAVLLVLLRRLHAAWLDSAVYRG